MREDHDGEERTSSRNALVVRQAIEEIWNQENIDVADNLFTPTYVNSGGLVPDAVRGPEAIKLAAALHHTVFPSLHVTIERMTSEGALVAFQWVASNHAPSTSLDYALDASDRMLRGMTFCLLTAGKIVESWTSWDSGGVLKRLVQTAGFARGRDSLLASGLS